MGLIPWRNKQEVPVRKEQAEQGVTLSQFRNEMDKLFENFFKDPWGLFGNESTGSGFSSWLPSLDVNEDDKLVNIVLEVPGLEPENVDISVSGNMLTVQGEKREEKEDKGKDYFHAERRFGKFRRTVELPSNTDTESIKADYKNGVLRITAKKEGGTEKKRIPIFP